MNKILFGLFTTCSCIFGFAQTTITVTGQLRDANTQEVLAFANVTVENSENNALITGAITTENGRFKIIGLPVGKYLFVFYFIGYETLKNL